MLSIEKDLYKRGFESVACIDEVGRGCLLGDVVACALIMPRDLEIEGVKDSKKLSPKRREALYDQIIEESLAYGFGRVHAKEIDQINIKEASRLAMKKAVENLKDKNGKSVRADFLLIDAESIDLDIEQKSLIKGDDLSHGIAAASILAKVYRDRLCLEWGQQYPEYNIEKHKGYGTKEHREKILQLGVLPIHRRTFLKKLLAKGGKDSE